MLIELGHLGIGLFLLILGGDLLVRGASGLARILGVPSLFIGLTVVAFGTSAPELVVNLQAVRNGQDDLAFGNVIGSSLANLGLILGLTALFRPLEIHSRLITREIPLLLLATAAAVVMGFDDVLDGTDDRFGRGDGLGLLLLFCVFIYVLLGDVLRKSDPLVKQSTEFRVPRARREVPINVLLTGLGFAGLIYGGGLTVDAASSIAIEFGVPEVFVGLSIVAVGTSLPELVTSIIAAFKGESDLAIGNVVGSNIFNLLFVLGITSTWIPVSIPDGGHIDLIALTVLSLILLPLSITHLRRITRFEGMLLLTLWAGYTAWRYLSTQ